MTVIAPERQSTWAPAFIVTLSPTAKAWAQLDFIQNSMISLGVDTTVPAKFANRDLVTTAGVFAHGRLLDDPVVDQGFFDAFWGVTQVTTVRFRLANADNALDQYHTRDVRGTVVTLDRYDEATGTTVSEFTGKVARTALGEGYLELEAVAPDLSIFERQLPTGDPVTVTTFPKAVDAGATVPVIFGNVVAHPCPYVNDDTGLNQYDYLVGRGALTVTAVYRDGPNGTLHLVNGAEYTVETTRYSGLTTLRFTNRQVNFSNAFHAIAADVTGLSAERNFARAIRTWLSDATYGLGQTVNAASFDAAEAALPAQLVCDGTLTAPRAASEVLRDLLMVRGMRLNLNSAGAWTLTVDTEQADVRMTIQDGTGDGERNLLSATARAHRSMQDSIRTYTLRFRWDARLGDYRLKVSRKVHNGFGRDMVLEHPWLRDVDAADRVVHYLAAREIWGNETVDVDVTQEARKAAPGERVTLTYAPLGFASQAMEVRNARKGLDRIGLTLGTWSANFYTYTAGFLPTDSILPAGDQSGITTRTDPNAPATPTGLAAVTGTGAAVSLDWTDNTEEDLMEYGVYRHTSDAPASATKIAEVRASRFVDVDVTIGTQYFYWVTAIDVQENESAKTGSVSATPGTVSGGQVDPTPPSQPVAFAKVAEATYLAGDGTVLAYLDFTLPAMPSGGVLLNLLYKATAATPYLIAAQSDAGAVTLRIDDLTPGRQYDVACQAVSNFGILSTVRVATSSPFTAPGDTTAPSAPSAIAVRQAGARIIEVDFTISEPADWGSVKCYRSTTTSTGSAVVIETKKAKRFHDQNINYGETYAYWGSALDLSLNESGLSAGEKITVAQIDTPDVGQNTITASASARTDTNITISTSTAALTTLASVTLAVGSSEEVFLWSAVRIKHEGTAVAKLWLYACTCELRQGAPAIFSGTCTDALMLDFDAPASSGSYAYSLRAADASIGATPSAADLRRLFVLIRKR